MFEGHNLIADLELFRDKVRFGIKTEFNVVRYSEILLRNTKESGNLINNQKL